MHGYPPKMYDILCEKGKERGSGMVLTFLSFVIITVVCFLAGFFVRAVSDRAFHYYITDPISIIVSGIAFSTVYAELYSLFGGVSLRAFLILIGFLAGVFLALRKSILAYLKDLFHSEGFTGTAVLVLILLAVVSSIASLEPSDYDTYLYHAQAIKWIETYGSVKGLANLHLRFGYNSAFLCLQALFSFSFTGRSFHEMNGYICFLMLIYAFTGKSGLLSGSREIKQEIGVSRLLKGAAVFYIAYNIGSISSPGTDLFPMLLLLYIFSRLLEIQNNLSGEDRIIAYGLLCLLAVLIITAKLSVAPVILLFLYPFISLLKAGRGKELIALILAAFLVGTPYLIRNVVLTGYLLYPMEKIDLFDVDWKVPGELAAADREEIGVYAKALQGSPEKDYSFREWVQTWYQDLELVPRILFFISGVLVLYGIYLSLRRILHKQAGLEEFLFAVSLILYLYWFFLAPNMRFGIVNLFLVSSLVLGMTENGEGIRVYLYLTGILLFAVLAGKADTIQYSHTSLIYPGDYKSFECKEVYYSTPTGKQVTIYVPKEGDQAGPDVFPESPIANGDYQELRGEDLKEGFRGYAF